jgi:hypothetical protein
MLPWVQTPLQRDLVEIQDYRYESLQEKMFGIQDGRLLLKKSTLVEDKDM